MSAGCAPAQPCTDPHDGSPERPRSPTAPANRHASLKTERLTPVLGRALPALPPRARPSVRPFGLHFLPVSALLADLSAKRTPPPPPPECLCDWQPLHASGLRMADRSQGRAPRVRHLQPASSTGALNRRLVRARPEDAALRRPSGYRRLRCRAPAAPASDA